MKRSHNEILPNDRDCILVEPTSKRWCLPTGQRLDQPANSTQSIVKNKGHWSKEEEIALLKACLLHKDGKLVQPNAWVAVRSGIVWPRHHQSRSLNSCRTKFYQIRDRVELDLARCRPLVPHVAGIVMAHVSDFERLWGIKIKTSSRLSTTTVHPTRCLVQNFAFQAPPFPSHVFKPIPIFSHHPLSTHPVSLWMRESKNDVQFVDNHVNDLMRMLQLQPSERDAYVVNQVDGHVDDWYEDCKLCKTVEDYNMMQDGWSLIWVWLSVMRRVLRSNFGTEYEPLFLKFDQ